MSVNPAKTRVSFALALGEAAGGGVLPANLYRSDDGATFVKWCGLLINAATLELQADYTR